MSTRKLLTAVVVGVVAYFVWTKFLASRLGF